MSAQVVQDDIRRDTEDGLLPPLFRGQQQPDFTRGTWAAAPLSASSAESPSVFIGGLHSSVTQALLAELCAQMGPLDVSVGNPVRLLKDQRTGLHYVCGRGKSRAVSTIINYGARINAKDAESIGDFASLGDDVPLSDGDFDTERWNYVSPDAYQAEVVWLLQWEEEKRGGPRKRVEMVAEKASSACAVS